MKTGIVRRLGYSLILPVAVLLICIGAAKLQDVSLFQSTNSGLIFIKAVTSIGLTTLALSINLSSGRFDFSLGSIALFASSVAGKLVINYQLGPWMLVLISLAIGIVLGAASGTIYVKLAIPPIITSLGVTLLYEGLIFMILDGKSLSTNSRIDIISFASVWNYLIILGVALLAMIYITRFTKFGVNYRALRSGQKNAVDTGIDEHKNAIACYMIAGGLMGLVGAVNLTYTGTAILNLNFGSISVMFTAFLPMFIGGFLSRYLNDNIGMLIGAVTTSIMSLYFVRTNASSALQSVINACALVLFLIYLNNEIGIKRLLRGKKHD